MGNVICLFDIEGEEEMISILDVANTFLKFGSMTHKKLQKLCYYAQAWHLAINDEPLVDAEFQAWIHGPVCPELYQKYKWAGAFRISNKEKLETKISDDSYEFAFLTSIFHRYGHLSGNELEALTHTEFPWLNARARAGVHYWEPSNEPISQEDMANYHKQELER